MIKGIIYKWTNKINGKIYIGKTIDENKRYSAHLHDRRYKSAFHNALDKYGVENFDYEVIFLTKSLSIENINTILNKMEVFYIKKFKSNNREYGYNLTVGGDGVCGKYGKLNPFYGRHHTDEQKQKQSEFIKSIYSKIQSSESKMKRNNSLKKVVHTDEWNKKVGLANQKKVSAYLDGKLVGTWLCYNDCAESLNLPNIKGISKVVCGHNKTYKGYTFTN